MTREKPKIGDEALYSITEAAEILRVSRRTLLRHTKMNKISSKIRKCNNRRVFTGREIKRYWGANL